MLSSYKIHEALKIHQAILSWKTLHAQLGTSTPWRDAERFRGSKRSQEEPGEAKRSQEEPGIKRASKSLGNHKEPPSGTRKSRKASENSKGLQNENWLHESLWFVSSLPHLAPPPAFSWLLLVHPMLLWLHLESASST